MQIETTLETEYTEEATKYFLFLSFRRVLNVICSFLGNSPASEFLLPSIRTQTPGNYQKRNKLHTKYLLKIYLKYVNPNSPHRQTVV